jgi:multidrug efflux system membrane fusion protein
MTVHQIPPIPETGSAQSRPERVPEATGPAALMKNRRLLALAGIVAAVAISAGVLFHLLGGGAPSSQAAVAVDVRTIKPTTIRLWSSFSGRMNAVDFAQIRPEVSGRITHVQFTDGQIVKAGDVLFVIDPEPYQAAVDKAEADLVSAHNNEGFAAAEFTRAQKLVKDQWIARSAFDQRATDRGVAGATTKSAEAALKAAQINLDRAYVKAPISGRVSRPEITVGNLVQAGANAPLLTSIVSNDGIYADFDVDEQTYMRSVRTQATTSEAEKAVPVELTVQGGAERVYSGTIYSFDNRIDTSSGTIRARARFQNEDGSLMPGMFVAVRLGSSAPSPVLLVPEQAVGNDQDKKFVYVVGADNKVQFRQVSLGESIDGARVVRTGLKDGERVVVNGLQKIAPNTPVDAREAGADIPGAPPRQQAEN